MSKNKYFALLGAVAVAATLGSAASASTSLSYDSSTGIITSTDILTVNSLGDSGDKLAYCKIVDIKYNATKDSISYAFTSEFQKYLDGVSETSPLRGLTIEQYQAITDAGTSSGAQVTGNKRIDEIAGAIAAGFDNCTNMTVSDTTATADVPFGAYVIKPVSRDDAIMSKVYGVIIANINVKEQGGAYIEDPDSPKTFDAKASDRGAIAKTINGGDDTYELGQEITYKLTATVPLYPSNATNKKIAVTDTLESGLTFGSYGTVKVADGAKTYTIVSNEIKDENSTKVGEVRVDGQTRTYVFYDALAVGQKIEITYTASLNGSATLGDVTGEANNNGNTAKLLVVKNPYDTSEAWEESTPSTKEVYTYGLKVQKRDATDQDLGLQGAEFDLCRTNSNPCPDKDKITHITMSSSDAILDKTVATLAAKTYYLVETKAPAGYVLPSGETAITTFTVTKGEQKADPYSAIVTVLNTKTNFNLPFTGGRGVIIYAIIGVGIVSVASIYYYRKKKNEA